MNPNKVWKLLLRDFNKLPESNFNIVLDVINRVDREVISQLEQKEVTNNRYVDQCG